MSHSQLSISDTQSIWWRPKGSFLARIFPANLWVLDMLGKYGSVSLLPSERSLGGSPSVNGGEIFRGALRELYISTEHQASLHKQNRW